jgi:hypothetical protein
MMASRVDWQHVHPAPHRVRGCPPYDIVFISRSALLRLPTYRNSDIIASNRGPCHISRLLFHQQGRFLGPCTRASEQSSQKKTPLHSARGCDLLPRLKDYACTCPAARRGSSATAYHVEFTLAHPGLRVACWMQCRCRHKVTSQNIAEILVTWG